LYLLNSEGYKTLHYNKLVTVAIGSIQEQQTRINMMIEKLDFLLKVVRIMAKLISIVPGSGLIYFSGATSSTINFRANSTTNNLDFFHGNNDTSIKS